MKCVKKIGLGFVTAFAALSLSSCSFNPLSSLSFDDFSDQVFLALLGNNAYNWNVFTENPKNFNYQRSSSYKAEWYSYEKMTEKDKKDAYVQFKVLYNSLTNHNFDKLDDNQKITYNFLEFFLRTKMDYYNPSNGYDDLMELEYVNQFGGYVSNLVDCVENYTYRNVDDIIDSIDFVSSSSTSFPTYANFVGDRCDSGYPLSDFTLDRMISYLSDIENEGSNYYLYDVFENKINSTSFLGTSQKNNYIERAKQALTNDFMPSVVSLKNDLAKYKGKCSKEGYISTYDGGDKFYAKTLADKLGYDSIDIDEYRSYLISWLDSAKANYLSLVKDEEMLNTSDSKKLKDLNDGNDFIIDERTPEGMLEYLKVFANSVVVPLKNTPEIKVKYMDETTAKYSNAVGYYMSSPIDAVNACEYITLNPLYLDGNYLDLLLTMSHEGYPGHLYAYVYDKELGINPICSVLKNLGFGEGWAEYVECLLLDYIAGNTDDEAIRIYSLEQKYQNIKNYVLMSLLDVEINYYGKGKADILKYYSEYSFESVGRLDLDYVYRRFIEIPTTYAPYGFGMIKMLDCHSKVKNELGNSYSESDFNAYILNDGWFTLSHLEKLTDKYILENK